MTERPRYARVTSTDVVEVAKQEAVEREYYCRGARENKLNGTWVRCGNASKYYIFVDGADEARQAICGVCRRMARAGTLKVMK